MKIIELLLSVLRSIGKRKKELLKWLSSPQKILGHSFANNKIKN